VGPYSLGHENHPAGFVVPARPIKASKPPSGADWVHEIKHDGYRLIVRLDGPTVRLYTRNAYDWTVRLPDGLSRFDELRRREAARTAILYAFDLIEHDSERLPNTVCRAHPGSFHPGNTEGGWGPFLASLIGRAACLP